MALVDLRCLAPGSDEPGQVRLVGPVRGLGPGQAGDLGWDAGPFQHQRVARGERLDLGEAQGLLTHVPSVKSPSWGVGAARLEAESECVPGGWP